MHTSQDQGAGYLAGTADMACTVSNEEMMSGLHWLHFMEEKRSPFHEVARVNDLG